MSTTSIQGEETQLAQTVEMFEVIAQSQPLDYQSLEILKEAYLKLGRDDDAIRTSKRIADAYLQLGQFSSAILEYETLLQRCPEDEQVQAALNQLASQTRDLDSSQEGSGNTARFNKRAGGITPLRGEDGRTTMRRVFVESRMITENDFEKCWSVPDSSKPPTDVIDPFIQTLADKAGVPVDKSLRLLSDKTRMGFLPLDRYDVDIELTRTFPVELCRRWCVLPFERMSKAILIATANPFSQHAAEQLAAHTSNRLVWYLAHPVEIAKNLRKAFR